MNIKEMMVWIVGLLLLAAVVASPVACTMNRQAVIAQAIKNGSDPIAVKCAIEADMSGSAMCILAAAPR